MACWTVRLVSWGVLRLDETIPFEAEMRSVTKLGEGLLLSDRKQY